MRVSNSGLPARRAAAIPPASVRTIIDRISRGAFRERSSADSIHRVRWNRSAGDPRTTFASGNGHAGMVRIVVQHHGMVGAFRLRCGVEVHGVMIARNAPAHRCFSGAKFSTASRSGMNWAARMVA